MAQIADSIPLPQEPEFSPVRRSDWYIVAMERLVEVVSELSQAHDHDSVIAIVRAAARELTGADGATFILRDGDRCYYAEENAISPLWKGQRFPMSNCISGWVMMNSTPAIIEDIYSDPRIPVDLYEPTFVRSLLVVPIRTENPIGAIGNYWSVKRLPRAEEVSILEALANVTSIALENASLYMQLQRSNRRKDEFLATLAHELRNPLAPISNALPVLRSETADRPLRLEAQNIISRQVGHMVRLVEDLMDLSRISRGAIELRREKVVLSEVVESAMEISGPLMKDHHHTLEIELPPIPVTINGDRVRLAQALANILNNSAKYTPPGGSIHLGARVEGGDVIIQIRDNGIGLEATALTDIFEMFTQVENSLDRSHGGLGIGLNLVKTVVELHGGRVEADSDGPGRGAVFTLTLPAEAVVDKDIHTGVTANTSAQKLKILVVDDNEASAKTLGWALELFGHDVAVAYNGPDAIIAAATQVPRVVLLDIGMPGMNGYDVCKTLRTNPDLSNTIIIAQTGWGQEEHRRLSAAAGFHHHLVKPVDIASLQSLLAAECSVQR